MSSTLICCHENTETHHHISIPFFPLFFAASFFAHLIDVLEFINDLIDHRIGLLHFDFWVFSLRFNPVANHSQSIAMKTETRWRMREEWVSFSGLVSNFFFCVKAIEALLWLDEEGLTWTDYIYQQNKERGVKKRVWDGRITQTQARERRIGGFMWARMDGALIRRSGAEKNSADKRHEILQSFMGEFLLHQW